MNSLLEPPVRTIADLLRRLGDIPADRVRLTPMPGTAKLEDLLLPENKHCELVDNTLVEKAVGLRESFLAGWILRLLHEFVDSHDLGIVTGADGFVELTGGNVRAPDVAFFSWGRLPNRCVPTEPIPSLGPDLVVEVLSEGNTPKEMTRKYQDYVAGNVCQIWEVHSRKRIVRILPPLDRPLELTSTDTLDGAPVLPGFTLPLDRLFAQLDRRGGAS